MKKLLNDKLAHTMSYETYRQLMQELVEAGKTTGPKQSESLANYTKMNEQRMKRLDKTVQLEDSLKDVVQQLAGESIFLVITEAWCGDAAQILPIFQKIAQENENIDLRLILRDEHPELMDQFLTDGAKAIPKLIVLDKNTLEVLTTWGPRPAPAQELLMEYKADPSLTYSEFSLNLQKWYNRDKGKNTQQELRDALKGIKQLYI